MKIKTTDLTIFILLLNITEREAIVIIIIIISAMIRLHTII